MENLSHAIPWRQRECSRGVRAVNLASGFCEWKTARKSPVFEITWKYAVKRKRASDVYACEHECERCEYFMPKVRRMLVRAYESLYP